MSAKHGVKNIRAMSQEAIAAYCRGEKEKALQIYHEIEKLLLSELDTPLPEHKKDLKKISDLFTCL
ncbi:MAG: hypothetical protein ACOYW7_08250 [Nitrospirota bacterium]